MAVDIHFMTQITLENFPELLTGQRGACFLFICDDETELDVVPITAVEKHIGSLAYDKAKKQIYTWDGTHWKK